MGRLHRDGLIRLRASWPPASAADRGGDLMGIAFDAPVALLLLIPALAITIGLHLGAPRPGRSGRRGPRSSSAPPAVALVLALAGFRLELPVDRLTTVFVVDLSDRRSATAAASTRSRSCARRWPRSPTATWRASSRSAGTRSWSGCPRPRRDRPDRLRAGPLRDRHRWPRCAWQPRCSPTSPEADRAHLRRQRHDGAGQSEAALAARRRIRIETRRSASGDADEVLIERLDHPSTARVGDDRGRGQDRSSIAQPATVRLFADGELVATQRVELDAGPHAW